MRIYLGIEVYYDYCNQYETVVKAFDSEEKVVAWASEKKPTNTEWRQWSEMEVE